MPRGLHAEIVGAGMGGLTAAAALAQRGWTVRVHERDPDLRHHGYGLATFENGLRVLAAVGAVDEATDGCGVIRVREAVAQDGSVIHRLTWPDPAGNRMMDIARGKITQALANAATRSGAEIAFGSEVVAARPEGEVELKDGRRLKADLVVISDGIRSKARDSLGIPTRRKVLADGCIRTVVHGSKEGREAWEQGRHFEYWSGQRRIIFVPMLKDQLFLALNSLNSDVAARKTPADADLWSRSFPHLEPLFRQLDPRQHADVFSTVKMETWHKGRVAVIGDAAHAQAPNLGQGAACATMSALSLSSHVEEAVSVEEGLALWERSERPVIEHAQFYSELYSRMMALPEMPRRLAFKVMSKSAWLARQRLRTANYVPKGANAAQVTVAGA